MASPLKGPCVHFRTFISNPVRRSLFPYNPFIIWLLMFLVTPSTLLSQEPDAVLSEISTKCSITKNGLLVSESRTIRINNRGGEQYATIRIPFDASDKIISIEGSISDKNGQTVRTLKKADILEKSNIGEESLFEDSYVREFTLKYSSYPYFISYSYEILTEEFIGIAGWVPLINPEVPTEKADLVVDVPIAQKVHIYQRNIASFNLDSIDGFHRYHWTAHYPGNLQYEILQSSLIELLPEVIVTADKFTLGIPGSTSSWIDFGNWMYNLKVGLTDLPASEKIKVDEIIAGKENDLEKVSALYKYLQSNTRYINVSIKNGRLQPYPASYVAVNKFGDCKALTNYFQSLLGYAGITSYYSLINAGDPAEKIIKEIPGQQFNHAILFVPLNGENIFLDCTSKLPFQYVGTFIQNREALIIKRDSSYFTRTPALTPDDVLENRRIIISRTPQGSTINVSAIYRGNKYEMLFYLLRSHSQEEQSKVIRRSFIPDGYETINFNLEIPDPEMPYTRLIYEANSTKPIATAGNGLYFKLIPFSIPTFTEPARRKTPVQLDWPISCTDTLEYPVPSGYRFSGDFKDENVESSCGFYTISAFMTDGRVIVSKSFLLRPGVYSGDDYTQLTSFIKKVQDIERTKYVEFIIDSR
jgi:hypothetical protein